MACSSREFFDDAVLEFMGKMNEINEASEDDIDMLFEALPLDWETMSPPQLHSYLKLESPTPLLHTLLCKIKSKERKRKYCQLTWVKRFNKWGMERQIGQKLEQIPKEQLDGILQLFFAEIHKNHGTNYEKSSFIHLLNLVCN